MGERYKGVFVEWIEEYSQFWQRCNWYTFHVIELELENDEVMGGVEFTVIVLGLGLRVRWNHTETEAAADIKRQVGEITEDS